MSSDNDRPQILIVEDDRRLSLIHRRALETEGYAVQTAFTLNEARLQLADGAPDVILLDVKLPDGSGFAFCREIREHTGAHIIFLTSVMESEGELEGLVAGGDDYLRKPYGIELLRERVKKALHKKRKALPFITRGSLRLDLIASHGYINGEDLRLTQKEFSVLLLLVQNDGAVMGVDDLYQAIWKRPLSGDRNAVQAVISRLRRKIQFSGFDIYFERERGYSFE